MLSLSGRVGVSDRANGHRYQPSRSTIEGAIAIINDWGKRPGINELAAIAARNITLLDNSIEEGTTEIFSIGKDLFVAETICRIRDAKTKEELVTVKALPAILERAESQHRYVLADALREVLDRV